MYVNQLNPAQVAQLQRDSQVMWGGKMSYEDRLAKMNRMLEVYGPEQFRAVGLVDDVGNVIASLKWFRLHVAVNHHIFRVFGIGAVFTPETHRRQGFAARLLNDACATAQREGYDAALLFSDIAPRYYAELKFRPLPAPQHLVNVADLPTGQALKLRDALPKDFSKLVTWYHHHWAPEVLHTHRTAAEWNLFRERGESYPDRILVHEGRDVGYLSAECRTGKLKLEEMVVEPELLNAAWAAVRQLCESQAITTVEGWLGPAIRPDKCAAHERASAIPMIRELSERFRKAEWDPSLAHFGSIDHY
jgi:predicted N-acetyltransferase YhbS